MLDKGTRHPFMQFLSFDKNVSGPYLVSISVNEWECKESTIW